MISTGLEPAPTPHQPLGVTGAGVISYGMAVATCRCGKVKFELIGAPILTASCHCDSCRRADEHFVALGAPSTLDADNGVPCVLVRKDRIKSLSGFELLRAYRLTNSVATRRTLATCCNTPMFIDPDTPWLSFFHARLGSDAPAVEMRLNRLTKEPASDGVPSAKTIPLSGMLKVLGTYVSVGFRSPQLDAMDEATFGHRSHHSI